MNRIAIIGISGSGKTTFAKQLFKKTGLPLYHMDTLYWKYIWTIFRQKERLEILKPLNKTSNQQKIITIQKTL